MNIEMKLDNKQIAENSVVQAKERTRSDMEIMFLGRFAPDYLKRRYEYTVDAPCWLHIDNKDHPLIAMQYGMEDIHRTRNLVPFETYATDLNIDIKGDVFKANIAGASFSEVRTPTWLRATKEGRIEQVIKFYPTISLCDLNKNITNLEKNGKGFPDRTDLKVVKAYVKDFYLKNENEVTLELVDGTSPVVHARVDPFVLREAGTGIGSHVYFIGTLIEKQYQDDFSIIMDVCTIIPISRTPLREPVNPAASEETGRILKISME